jgi:hypothetical protein
MITQPTTDQIILDCCRELIDTVLPEITDQVARVRLAMVETTLRNAAVRSAHEIAWAHDEIAAILQFARRVHAAIPDQKLQADLLAYEAEHPAALHLDPVVRAYSAASRLLTTALRLAEASGNAALRHDGDLLVDRRLETEQTILAGWSPTGR